MITPDSGRLLIRHLAEGAVLVGVLHLPPEVTIVEGAAYALRFDGCGVALAPEPVAGPLPVEHGWAVSDWLAGHAWFRSTDPMVLTVRFVAAFPESNGWVVCGATPWSLAASRRDAGGHSWSDVRDGVLTALEPPCDARGMAVAQVIAQVAVWPDAVGEPHRLSQVMSAWRPVLLQLHQLLAQAGRGVLTLAQARERIHEDQALRHVGAGALDPTYCRYLALLEDRVGLRLDAPEPSTAYATRERLAGEMVASLSA